MNKPRHVTIYEPYIYGLVHDYIIESVNYKYVYDLLFNTHPLLLERSGDIDHYRLSTSDIDYIQVIHKNTIVSTIPNYLRDEPVVHHSQIPGIHATVIDPFKGDPIVTGLLDGDITLRIVFWRSPIAPFWITYRCTNSVQDTGTNTNTSHKHRYFHTTTQSYDGRDLTYMHGELR